jgi:hypothetical protein
MKFGASMFFTDYSMPPAELACALEQGCSTLSTEFPLEERIGSGESGGVSILTEC